MAHFHVSTFISLIVSILVASLLQRNPFWIGRTAGPPPANFQIFTSHPILDAALDRYQNKIGDDFEPYRNHNLRVLSFAAYHLGDRKKDERMLDLMGFALAYHDIGLWSEKELDYLEPSVAALEKDITMFKSKTAASDDNDNLEAFVKSLSSDEIETLRQAIWQHHKLTKWIASPGSKVDEGLVNAIRMGDWADATIGAVRFELPESCVEAAYRVIAENGFHMMLAGMGQRLRPNAFLGGKLAMPNIF